MGQIPRANIKEHAKEDGTINKLTILIIDHQRSKEDKRRYFIWIEDKNPNQPRPRDTISAHPIPKLFEYTYSRRTKDIASVILNAFAFIHPNNFRNILPQQCIAQTTLYMSLLWYPWRKRRSFRRYLTMDRYPSFLPSSDEWMTLRYTVTPFFCTTVTEKMYHYFGTL